MNVALTWRTLLSDQPSLVRPSWLKRSTVPWRCIEGLQNSRCISHPSVPQATSGGGEPPVEKRLRENRLRYRNRWARGKPVKSLDVFQIDDHGKLEETSCSLSTLAEVHARDLKALDHEAVHNPSPCILPRKECIIVSISYISCIIFKDRVILLNSGRPVVAYFAQNLSRVLRNYQVMSQAEQEWLKYRQVRKQGPLGEGETPPNAPEQLAEEMGVAFELRVLESILCFVCIKYENRLACMNPVINTLLEQLGEYDNPQTEQFHRLLGLKTTLSAFERAASDLDVVLEDLLESEEDMLEMFLTAKSQCKGHPLPIETHQPLELMLESYSREIGIFKADAFFLRKKCETTEDLMRLALDSYRNKMIRIQVKLAQATTGLACGTIFTGMFGMNLLSGLENHPLAFYNASATAIALSLGMYWSCLYIWGRPSIQTKKETFRLAKMQSLMDQLGDVQDFILSKMHGEMHGEAFTLEGFRKALDEASERTVTRQDVEIIFDFYAKYKVGLLYPHEVVQFLCDQNARHYRSRENMLVKSPFSKLIKSPFSKER
eukprot:gb/GEZN01002770.1/.p1 GENE.gb/GEZN01002770.1/~~gb/GEZN01002770.1/.p1  ORF type:complete len:547 (+),score=82.23 gb/GEZN01002770.1/:18-1658(+)